MNGNSYIIPVPTNTDVFAKAMTGRKYTSSFYYSSGKKHSRVEFWMKKISNTEKVYVYRDIDENEKCRYNYQHCIELGKAGYTPDGYEKAKEFFGVYVLQTSSKKKAEAIFTDYKKRWGIETFYQYLKNSADFNNLMMQDYYKEQGFSFIMLITGQIHQQIIDAVKLLNDNTMSVSDVLLMAKFMKLELKGSTWNLKNTRKRDLQILEKMKIQTQADIRDKVAFDPDRAKRRKIWPEVSALFPEYRVFVGGSSSFDMTPAPYDKKYALERFCREEGIRKEEVAYVGDDYGPGGNDEPVFLAGYRFICVDDHRKLGEALEPLLEDTGRQ